MNTYLEGRNNHFFLAGLTHFIGLLITSLITMIFNYITFNIENYYTLIKTQYYVYGIVGAIFSLLVYILLFMAFSRIQSSMNLRSSEDTQTIAKVFLALLILIGLRILSYLFSFIDLFMEFMFIVIASLTIFSAIAGFFAYFYIWKLIKKQELNGIIKIVSYAFLIYSITILLSGIFSGLYQLGIMELSIGVLPLSGLFGMINGAVSYVVAFIFILFSIRLANQTTGIIVPKQIPETVIDQKQCSNCGSILSDDVKFCVKCGTKIE